jgi:hypothetical protein
MSRKFRILFKLLLLIALFGLFCSPLNAIAEDVDVEFEVVEDVTAPTEDKDLDEIIEEFIDEKGWTDGKNVKKSGKEFFITTGSSIIGQKTSSKNFIGSRQIAFTKAMAIAKRKMVEFIAVEIETSMSLEMERPSEEREEARVADIRGDVMSIEAKKKAAGGLKSDLQKKGEEWGSEFVKNLASGADRLYREKLDKQLRAKGIDPNKPVEAQVLKKVFSESFQESTKAMAQQRISGIQAFTTFEHLPKGGDAEIGVIAIYSDKLHAMALAIHKGGVLIPPGTSRKPLKQQLPKDKTALLMSFGVQLKTDENGELNLVSFCQAGQKGKRDKRAAKRTAVLCAQKQIRSYAGESLHSTSLAESAESVEEFENGMSVVEDDSSLKDAIKTASKKMDISGIANLKQWQTKHPVSGHKVRGAVVYWSPGTAATASSMSRMGRDDIPAEFSKAAQEKKNAAATSSTKKKSQPKQQRALSGKGTSGSDDF